MASKVTLLALSLLVPRRASFLGSMWKGCSPGVSSLKEPPQRATCSGTAVFLLGVLPGFFHPREDLLADGG